MASTLSDSLAAEEADELPEADEFRRPNEYELRMLELNPCLPIFMSNETMKRLHASTAHWQAGCRSRSRAVPATASREFIRAEGSL